MQGVQMTDKLTAAVKHPGFYQAYVKAFAMVCHGYGFCTAWTPIAQWYCRVCLLSS